MRAGDIKRLLAPASVMALLLACQLARAEPASGGRYYQYEGQDGRVVYTNIEEQVPLEQRESGRIDLSKVALNSELARQIDDRFEQEHAALTETPYCEQARRAAAEASLVRQLWDEYGPLLVCGGLLLLFALYTPRALKRYGAPQWAKVLTMVIPSLTVVGVVGFTLTQAHRSIGALKARAEPCERDTFAALSSASDPLTAHQALIEQLKQQIERARQ